MDWWVRVRDRVVVPGRRAVRLAYLLLECYISTKEECSAEKWN